MVPAEASKWKYDPFIAHKDEKGDIYARGTQDMKVKIFIFIFNFNFYFYYFIFYYFILFYLFFFSV